MTALEVFHQKNGDVTKAYYAHLDSLGLRGQIGTSLFRAQKRSSAAKSYRGGRFRRAAYDVKNWSITEIVRLLYGNEARHGLTWGWKRDPNTPGYAWVLYVDLPTGQVSFHSAERLSGPDYAGDWDGVRDASVTRILEYCDSLVTEAVAA